MAFQVALLVLQCLEQAVAVGRCTDWAVLAAEAMASECLATLEEPILAAVVVEDRLPAALQVQAARES
jgi:hypothetical protein